MNMIPVAWRAPFDIGNAPYTDLRPWGESVLDIVHSVPNLPPRFMARGVVCINGEPVPRDLWRHVRPKPGNDNLPVAITMHLPLQGGGDGNSTAKSVGALVATLALVVITGGIAGGALAPTLGSAFAAGTFGAKALAAGVGLAGSLAISALTPPPSVAAQSSTGLSSDSSNTDQKQPAAATGNVLRAGGPIDRVLGTRKVFPPLIGEPIVELVEEDEYVEAGFCLNGPHEWSDVRVDGVSIDEAEDIEYETKEGWISETNLTLVTRQGRTITPQITLSVHKVDSANQNKLLDPSEPDDDLPVWHGVATRSDPDEIWLHLLLPNGLSVNGSTSTDVVVPIRTRIRKKGAASWTNLPEFHVSDSTLQQRRRALIFKFATNADYSTVVPPTASGFVYANINVPGQSTAPATTGWDADSYFIGLSGDDYLSAANAGGSKVANVALYSNRVEVYLDPEVFTAGIYEIEIIRGAAFLASSFTKSSYVYSGSVQDFFTYSGTSSPAIPMSRANLADSIQLIRVISIWNEYPVLKKGVLALLAVKARNREVKNVSAIASGLVRDWDGSAWTTWTATSNPAPHYVDILSGAQNLDPLPEDLRDDTGLVAWRTLCASQGWTVDMIIDDFRTQDALSLVASCGYAKPYQSEIYGVTVDSDTSEDDPIQIFSRRNARNVRYEKAFARVPDGLIINFVDAEDDYNNSQVIVYQRDRSIATTGLLETVTYDGIVITEAVEVRGQFDLDQGNERSTFYYLDTDIESIVCRRGDLVGLQHDSITRRAGDALIKSKFVNNGDITAFLLDSKIQVTNEPDMHSVINMHAVEDMHDVGITTGICIRRSDGTLSTHLLSDPTGETDCVHPATPIGNSSAIEALDDTQGRYGCMITSGALNSEYLRLKVAGITAKKNLEATLTLVDEAQSLVRYAA